MRNGHGASCLFPHGGPGHLVARRAGRWALGTCVAALHGCSSLPPVAAPHAAPPPLAFRESGPAAADAASFSFTQPELAATEDASPRWWAVFADPALDALIARADAAHPLVDAALALLAQARAGLGAAEAQRRPLLGLAAGFNRQGGPLVNAAGAQGNLLTLAASASYEADLFGHLSAPRKAAALDVQAQRAAVRSAHLLLQAEVAQTYFALRAIDGERALARRAAAAQAEALRVIEARWRSGSLAESAVARQRQDAAQHDAESAALDRRRAELDHALALLQGLSPAETTLADGSAETPGKAWAAAASASEMPVGSVLSALPQIPAGIPSQVLARRPDVAATQRALDAALLRAGAARSAGLPSLVLTASGGHASQSLLDLLHASSRAWGLGALLALPVFDGGRREAGVQQADAQLAARAAEHRSQVLQALREVEDQLSALRFLGIEAAAQARAAAAAEAALGWAQSRQRRGLAGPLEVIDAQQAALHAQRLGLQARAAQAQATVALVKALGGGWGAAGLPAETPPAAGPAAHIASGRGAS